MTAVAIMMLWEAGRLELDDELYKYNPRFKNMEVLVGQEDKDGNPLTEPALVRRNTACVLGERG